MKSERGRMQQYFHAKTLSMDYTRPSRPVYRSPRMDLISNDSYHHVKDPFIGLDNHSSPHSCLLLSRSDTGSVAFCRGWSLTSCITRPVCRILYGFSLAQILRQHYPYQSAYCGFSSSFITTGIKRVSLPVPLKDIHSDASSAINSTSSC